MKHQNRTINVAWSLALVGAIVLAGGMTSRTLAQQLYASPEDAITALTTAVKAKDKAALGVIFGPRIKEFLSGDEVADTNQFSEFAANLAKGIKFDTASEQRVTLVIGEDDWPFAAPIIRSGSQWRFDTAAGIEELLNRRIGENELVSMLVCQAYAIAQFEYFNGDDHDGDQVSEYAQKIASSPGKMDGLYWPKESDDDDESPLGELFAYATAVGYKTGKGTVQTAAPFHGYNFKVLNRQGASAPGGKFDYIINGNMIAGFALVAYPATWGNSGVMTFIVNQEGRVYQKNLGPRTAAIAGAMTEYNPDVTWSLADLD